MAELAKIMARTAGRLRAYVVFISPSTVNPEWGDTELRKTASQIPGVTVITDQGGETARRFGGETSGHTFLFDRSGRCVFSGGITAFRGHAGDNLGETAIVARINGDSAATNSTLVFGCALNNEKDAGK